MAGRKGPGVGARVAAPARTGRPAGAALASRPQWTSDRLLEAILRGPGEYAVFATDAQGLVSVWSRGAATLFGRQDRAVVGAVAWWDLIARAAGPEQAGAPGRPQQPSPGWRRPLEQADRAGHWAGLASALRQDGGHVPVRVAVVPMPGTEGTAGGHLTLCLDLSAEERRLRELADARFVDRGRFEVSAAPMYVTDLLGVVTDVNQATVDMIGWPREQLIGAQLVTFADDPERAIAAFGRVLREGRLVGLDFGARRADGQIVPVQVSGAVINGPDGKPREVLVTHTDMTPEIELRERLHHAQEYYRELVESGADLVVVLDSEGFVAEVVGQARDLLGRDREDLVGAALADLFAEPGQVRGLIRRAAAGEDAGEAEWRLAGSGGAERRALARFHRLSGAAASGDGSGDGPALAVTLRDVTEISRLREEAASERASHRRVIEASPSGLVICDLGQRISEVNAAACELVGREREQMIGSELRDCCADPGHLAEMVDRALLTDQPVRGEVEIAGSGRLAELTVSILRDEEAKGRGVLAFVRDISEEARLRQRVSAERAYARAVQDGATVSLFVVDAEGVIKDTNTAAERMTGIARRRLLGRRLFPLFTDPRRARAGVERAFAEGYIEEYELTLAPPGRPTVPAAFYGGLLTDPWTGEPRLMVAVRDMSPEKATREGLHLYIQSLYAATADALVLTDLHGRITDVNRQMEIVTGRSREELSGASFEECFTDRDRAHRFVEEVLRQGQVADVELTVRRADGVDTVLWYSAGTFTDTEGKLEGVFASGRDVTERNRLQALQAQMLARATELDQAKSEFVSRVSHELRSPLTSVMGYLEVLRDDDQGTLTSDQHAMLDVIDRNAERLLSLIEDLLLLSRIESGTVSLQYETVDLGALIDGVHESFLPAIERHGLTSRVEVEPGITLQADPRQLERAAVNLVSNAVKFTPPGGRIWIRARREGDEAALEVRDTGMGIPVEEQSELFTRFYRSSLSRERETQGTGLGLFIVKNVVEAHGGAVEVVSAPDQGAAFTLRLPLRRPGGPV